MFARKGRRFPTLLERTQAQIDKVVNLKYVKSIEFVFCPTDPRSVRLR
jgi:hypothetical protein